MKAVILLATLIAVSNAAATICPMVTCDSGLSSGCLSSTKNTDTWEVKIKKCDSNQYCNITLPNILSAGNGTTASCANFPNPDTDEEETPAVTGRYPGYDCTADSECALDCGSNGCDGLGTDSQTDCAAFNMGSTEAVNATMCGANLYCDANSDCVAGKDAEATCTNNYECKGRLMCLGGACVAPGGLENGNACPVVGGTWYCPSNNYCNALTCAEADQYSTGSFGMACEADADCSGDCDCSIVNTEGKGNCGALADGTEGRSAINTLRTAYAAAEFNCPLGWAKTTSGGCAGTYSGSTTLATLKTASCYTDFIVFGGVLPTHSSSAYGVYASIFGFIAYLLA